jgi:hypothetical protein
MKKQTINPAIGGIAESNVKEYRINEILEYRV